MKRMFFVLTILLITTNLFAETVFPTIRGWIKFNNKVTRNAVYTNVGNGITKARKVFKIETEDFDVIVGTQSETYTINFYVNFDMVDKSYFDTLVTSMENLEFTSKVIDFRFVIFYDVYCAVSGNCKPDVIDRIITK